VNKMHPEAGMMQALLDGELNEEKASKLKEHLKECADCQKLYSELKENQDFNQKAFKSFEGLTLKRNFKFEKKKGLRYMLKKSKKGMAAIAVGLVLAIFIAFPPARAVAEDFLQIFRVNRLETVEITAQDIEEMRNALENAQGTVDLKEFGSLTASNVSYEAKDTTIEEAQKVLGFELKEVRHLPFDLKSKDYTMIEPGEVKFNLNVDKVNSFINSLGGTKLLPQELNGQEFTIEFGGSLTIVYFPADTSSNVIILNETSLPEVTVPEGINAEEVRESVLELPFIPEHLKTQLAAIDNWQETLPIPVPEDAQIKDTTINGKPAIFCPPTPEMDNSLVAWIEDGILYSLSGDFQNEEEALKAAESVR